MTRDPGAATGGRLGAAALGRAAAAGAGALAGGLIALPVAGRLGLYLLNTVGTRLVEDILESALDDVSGIAAFFVAIFALVLGVMLAALVVLALVAPLFVVLPMAGTAVALRLARAGLILHTAAWTLAWLGALALAGWALADLADQRIEGWTVLPAIALAGLLARAVVEVRHPERAGTPDRDVLGRRWKRTVLGWLLVLVIGVTASAGFVLLVARVSWP